MTKLLEANAGTGKTYSIIQLILNDILVDKIPLNKILALTFTNKAANELRHRLATKLIQKRDENPDLINKSLQQLPYAHIGTIHSFCFRFLKEYSDKLDLSPYFEIDTGSKVDAIIESSIQSRATALAQLDDFKPIDVWYTVRQAVRDNPDLSKIDLNSTDPVLNNELKKLAAEELEKRFIGSMDDKESLKFYLKFKGSNKDVKNYVNHDNTKLTRLVELINPIQQESMHKLKHEGYLTYEMLINFTRGLLKANKSIREKEKSRYLKIYMDELQDTDPLQYEIILYLSEQEGSFTNKLTNIKLHPDKLCVVGDWKQSIYGFRGADLSSYETFKTILKQNKCHVELLNNNYRSCKHLVEFSNKFAEIHFPEQANPSTSQTNTCNNSNCIEIHSCKAPFKKEETLIQEALFIAGKIQELSNKYDYKNIAVLLRKLTKAHILISELNKANIPFVVEGTKFIYQIPEVMDFISVLKLVTDPNNPIALLSVSRSTFVPLSDDQIVSGYQSEFIDKLRQIANPINSTTPPDLLMSVFNNLPIFETLELLPNGASSIRYILSIYHQSFKYMNMSCTEYTDMLVENCMRAEEEDSESSSDEMSNAVRIMTIHKSKGLEHAAVIVSLSDFDASKRDDDNEIIYDWSNDKIGIKCSSIFNTDHLKIAKKSELEISRELYVAFTRAKNKLIITDFSKYQKLLKQLPKDYENQIIEASANTILPKVQTSCKQEQPAVIPIQNAGQSSDQPNSNVQMVAGEAAHYVMQKLNFKNHKLEDIKRLLNQYFKSSKYPTIDIESDLLNFVKSKIFKWISSSKLIAREKEYHGLINGELESIRIDLLIEDSNHLWILDYKYSDKLSEQELKQYKNQLDKYAFIATAHYKQPIKKALILIKSCNLYELNS